jgi:hypothetical protein
VSGEFVPDPDFHNATLTAQGSHCILQLPGELNFSGTVEGVGNGTSTVRLFAPCADVEIPGSLSAFRSVFRSEGAFVGMVEGEAAQADFVYKGRSELGGRVDARMHFSGSLQGVLHVAAKVAEGGSYQGFVIRR